jgi:uncharacterized damage-inducible protein DinB
MAIKDALLADYDHEMGTTRRLLERVPDDKLAWRPHDKSRSMGDLATHVSRIPSWGGIILASFNETSARTRASMDKIDGEYNALWTLKRSGQQVFSVPRVAAFRSFVLHHIIHHRGQLSVYLRLNDILVPAIYGPSADEGS